MLSCHVGGKLLEHAARAVSREEVDDDGVSQLPTNLGAKVCHRRALLLLEVCDDGCMLALLVQMMEVICGLIPILMQQHPSLKASVAALCFCSTV